MSVITVIKKVKEIYPSNIALVRIGNFFHVYGKDSYILSFLFGYKLKKIENDCITCGFPDKSLGKVQTKLENKKINYIILNRRNNYDVDENINFKNLNKYDEIFEKAKNYINLKKRIDNIYAILVKKISSKDIKIKIHEIEKILN